MKIAFDAQLLNELEKTGVALTSHNILLSMHEFGDLHLTLNYFSLSLRNRQRMHVATYEQLGFAIHPCKWFHATLYKMLWGFVPVPYSLFFGKGADVTQFFNYSVPPGVSGKKVTIIYDMVCKAYPETMNWKNKLMLALNLGRSCKRADKIVTISEFSKQEIIKYMGVPEEKLVVMPCGVDLNRFFPQIDGLIIDGIKSKYGIDGQYLLYLGTLEPRKNIERLINAYAQLKSRLPDAPKLVLAGRKGWMYESIFKTVSELKLENSVIFTGYIEDSEAPALLGGATAFLFPSLYEGFGMPPLEAMACGTPVLTSNCSSLPEVVGDAAVLVDPYSVEDIAAGMERLVTDAGLRKELSGKGLERAKDFTWERSAKILMDVYKSLVEE